MIQNSIKNKVLFVILTFIYLTSYSQYKSVKIGDQVWMAENLRIDVNGSYVFNGKAEYEKKYGRLYTYEAAQKVCPAGWHLPSDQEWDKLAENLGGEENAAKALKLGGSSGFNALAAGYANGSSFWFLDSYGGFWSSTAYDGSHAWYRFFTNQDNSFTKSYFNKKYGFSVRCVKN